jgi:hypothetical protein
LITKDIIPFNETSGETWVLWSKKFSKVTYVIAVKLANSPLYCNPKSHIHLIVCFNLSL